jgi:hypothetical protein
LSIPDFSRAISSATLVAPAVEVAVTGAVWTDHARASPVVPIVAAVTTTLGTVARRRRRASFLRVASAIRSGASVTVVPAPT